MNKRSPTVIIAEAGVNHNGSLDMAIELVDAAASAGADYVKFQTFRASRLANASAPKAQYQKRTTDVEESQLEMLSRLELSEAAHDTLLRRCQEKSVSFLSSPFDHESLALLTERFKLPVIKLGSGELTNAPLLLDLARRDVSLILSTGMATLAEVEQALGVLAFGYSDETASPSKEVFSAALLAPESWQRLKEKVTLLHCTTEYPAAVEDTNLNVMETLRNAFGLQVGYSDHTEGNAISLAAVAMGACVIEKHFTLDRALTGPDHAASIEPAELHALVRDIRRVEQALGRSVKIPGKAEIANREVARKSLFAARDIGAGEILRPEDISVMRPGTGLAPVLFWDMIGKKAEKQYKQGDPL